MATASFGFGFSVVSVRVCGDSDFHVVESEFDVFAVRVSYSSFLVRVDPVGRGGLGGHNV